MVRFAAIVILVIALAGGGLVAYRHETDQPTANAPRAATVQKKAAPPKVDIAAGLTAGWQAASAGFQNKFQIAVYDHASGQTAAYGNTTDTLNTASIAKLSILETLLWQDEQQGTGLTDAQLQYARPMIENSNNDAATALWEQLGGTSTLNAFFQRIGASSTAAGSYDYWGLTQTTAADQLKVVDTMAYPNDVLSAASRDAAGSLLDGVEADQHWGVSGGVPAGVHVRLKNGWLQGSDPDSAGTWDINSIGHVYGGGEDYTIAVLTADNASEQSGIDAVQALSAATWQYLSTH